MQDDGEAEIANIQSSQIELSILSTFLENSNPLSL